MDTIYTLVHRHCHNLLKAHGWPDDMEISTSLGHSQGDGVAFYGRLNHDEMLSLLASLVTRQLLPVTVADKLGNFVSDRGWYITLGRNGYGYRYAHASCIEIFYDDVHEGMCREVDMLMIALREDIKMLCKQMETESYQILEAIYPSVRPVVLVRKTAHFFVTAKEVDPQGHDGDNWCTEVVDRTIDAIVNQGATLRTLEITVRNWQTGQKMSQSWISDVMRLPGQPVRQWFDRGWLSDAIDEARDEIKALLGAFTTFRPVA
jgi:hypothetical protein